jgi:hypothetical protein
MTMMLRHKPTGDVYIYTDLLSRRDDMEVFEAPPAEPAKLKATVTPVVEKAKPVGEKQ